MIGVVTSASAWMPCALSSALVMGGCRGLGLNGAMVPLVLCGQYVCSPEQPLYSPRWGGPNRWRVSPSARAAARMPPFLWRPPLCLARNCLTVRQFGPSDDSASRRESRPDEIFGKDRLGQTDLSKV